MKKSLLITLLLLTLLAAACQTASPGGQTVETEAAPPPGGAYPAPGGSYPAPGVTYPGVAADPNALYPFYGPGNLVAWEHAIAMILNGEVASVAQSHDLTVSLTLKDGRTLMTTEPAIDDIMQVIQTCGEPCTSIQVATE